MEKNTYRECYHYCHSISGYRSHVEEEFSNSTTYNSIKFFSWVVIYIVNRLLVYFTFEDLMQIVFHNMRSQYIKSFGNDVICFSVQYRVLTESCLSQGPERILIVLALWTLSFQEFLVFVPLWDYKVSPVWNGLGLQARR